MSVLDRATNDALNAVIDLHAAGISGDGMICLHCSMLPGALPVPFPCPTIAVLTVAAETTVPHDH